MSELIKHLNLGNPDDVEVSIKYRGRGGDPSVLHATSKWEALNTPVDMRDIEQTLEDMKKFQADTKTFGIDVVIQVVQLFIDNGNQELTIGEMADQLQFDWNSLHQRNLIPFRGTSNPRRWKVVILKEVLATMNSQLNRLGRTVRLAKTEAYTRTDDESTRKVKFLNIRRTSPGA